MARTKQCIKGSSRYPMSLEIPTARESAGITKVDARLRRRRAPHMHQICGAYEMLFRVESVVKSKHNF